MVRSIVGRHNPEGIEPNAFTGRVLIQSLFGFCADLWDHNAHRIERTRRDVRLDDVKFYHAVFQVVGRSTILQNDEKVTPDVGDIALVDSTKPVTFLNDAPAQWLSLQLPRRSLISHLGQEPRGGSGGRRGTCAGQLLYQLVLNEFKDGSLSTPTGVYMQFALSRLGYDAAGLLAPSPSVDNDPIATMFTSFCPRKASAKRGNARPSSFSASGVSQVGGGGMPRSSTEEPC